MTKHSLLRAYLAGICVPTVFLLLVAAAFTCLRYVYDVPLPVERVIVFPMAAVPNVWGLWNVLFVKALAPRGFAVARLLEFPIPRHVLAAAPFGLPVAMILYYLAWKYLVGSLNGEL